MPPPQPANRYRGLGWALRACDGARADELSKDYRALRTCYTSVDWAGPSVLPQKRQQQLPKDSANERLLRRRGPKPMKATLSLSWGAPNVERGVLRLSWGTPNVKRVILGYHKRRTGRSTFILWRCERRTGRSTFILGHHDHFLSGAPRT